MKQALGWCCVLWIATLGAVGCSSTPQETVSTVLVQGGTFTMGDAHQAGDPDELPTHQVTLDTFYMARYPVTRGEFREFVESTGYVTTAETEGGIRVYIPEETKLEVVDDASWRDLGFPQADDHPVVGVSWFDAVRYCNWRSEQEGLDPAYRIDGTDVTCDFAASGYRLPTEAEFEYANRDPNTRGPYAWGDGNPLRGGLPTANIKDETAHREQGWNKYWEGYEDGHVFTSPVDALAPNDRGLHDMTGNVYQWCWDWIDEDYYQVSPTVNPRGPAAGEMRSARSSGYGCPLKRARAANRGAAIPNQCFENTGFRLARSVS
jgi:formylglycine-generating enzyme required for sulfatase activity